MFNICFLAKKLSKKLHQIPFHNKSVTTTEQKNKNKILILKSNKSEFEEFFIKYMQNDNVDTLPIYRVRSGLCWNTAVVWIEKLGHQGNHLFYGRWKKNIKNYDTVIVFDRNLNWNIFQYIKDKNPEIRCIAWYWNPIKDIKRWKFPEQYRNFCEVWSFDENDCNRFNYNNNVQFYFYELTEKDYEIKYDAFFVGVDKGRYNVVEAITSRLQLCGKETYMGIVADKLSDSSRDFISQMEYETIIDLIQKSKCIIDVPQQGQDGITLRVLEALFWRKKLITTNPRLKDYMFYHKSNIFIWDNPSDDDIYEFFCKPIQMLDEEIIRKYSFEGWLENFKIRR